MRVAPPHSQVGKPDLSGASSVRSTTPDAPTASRAARARLRALEAHHALSDCHLCAHHCGVNRLAGELGRCHAGVGARGFLAQTEVNDEPELAPCFAIALSGCDLRCDFCISGAESWYPMAGDPLDIDAIAGRAAASLASGARSIMILGGEPSIHLPSVLELVARLPDTATLVWKTNAHGTAQTRFLLEGLFDVWVADYKFGNDACAERLAHVTDYTRVVRSNLRWAARHTHLIVRHLIMPGHLECCWEAVAEWLGHELPAVTVSLRGGFWPGWRSTRHRELSRTTTSHELERAREVAKKWGLRIQP